MKLSPVNPEPNLLNALPLDNNTAIPDFSHYLFKKLTDTNQSLIKANQHLQNMAKGKNTNLPEVMIRLEEAKMSLQFLGQLRNRILNAYQEIFKEQI